MDSIRSNQTKEDMITTIRMELSNDISCSKGILLVEGTDDVKFVRKVFNSNVICYESFSGKVGLRELLESPEIVDERVIAVRDRDYSEEDELPQRMFVYDACCLELMMLQCKEVVDGLYFTYYRGNLSKEEYALNAMRNLAPYSIMRMKNEKNGLEMNFSSIGFGNLISDEGELDIEALSERMKNAFVNNTDRFDQLWEMCKTEAADLDDGDLFKITNGHDICLYLGIILKSGKNSLGEKGVRDALFNSYRKSDFSHSYLYSALRTYQVKHRLVYVD